MNFIDFKKAFDFIHRPSMRKVVRYYSIPEKIIHIVDMYDDSMCCVRAEHGHTDWFSVETGWGKGTFFRFCFSTLFLTSYWGNLTRRMEVSPGRDRRNWRTSITTTISVYLRKATKKCSVWPASERRRKNWTENQLWQISYYEELTTRYNAYKCRQCQFERSR